MLTALRYNARLRQGLGNFILVFMSVGIVILYSSYQRPLWLDEFLQFGFSGFKATGSMEIANQILQSVKGINNGHTGFLFYLNYISLDLAGASSVTLRLPSILAGLATLIIGTQLLRTQGYSLGWQILVLLSMAASSFAMYYFGEAREYSILAACVLFIVYYFALPKETERTKCLITMMYLVVIIGSFNHFWFPLYLIAFSIFFAVLNQVKVPSRDVGIFVRGLALPFWVVSLAISAVVAMAGWWGSASGLGRDPFEFTRGNGGFIVVWIDTHFQFLPVPKWSVWFVLAGLVGVVAVLLLAAVKSKRHSDVYLSILTPVGVILLALILAFFLSVLSVATGNWILNRYWMGGLLLVPIGTVWFLAALYTYLKPRFRLIAYGLAVSSFIIIGSMALYRLNGQIGALQSYAATAAEYREKYAGVTIEDSQRLYDELGPVEAANVNIYIGGPVWPVFSCFYGCEEGYENRR